MSKWKRAWQKRVRRLKSGKNRRHSRKNTLKKTRLLSFLAISFFLGLVVLLLGGVALFAWYAKDLPHPEKIIRREGFSTKIYDRNEELLYDIYADQKRVPVKLEAIPLFLRQATIAIEDKHFYKHQGFDPLGMIRAVYKIVVQRRLQGGSTLTQQLVKNVLLSQKRVISRKIKEFILAIQIENRYDKDEILQMYLNEAPYGGTAWGVEAASQSYFGQSVSELGLIKCAILAGLPQSPTRYSPFGQDPKSYLGRTKSVLRRMREDGYISREEEKEALDQLDKVQFSTQRQDFKAPHFVMYVKSILEDRYGQRMVEQGGLRVQTTLDLSLQEKAQEIVAEEISRVESLQITNGAALVIDPQTGQILAMVGSKNYFDPDYDGKVNVTLSLRQPGSAIKPVTYLTALQSNYTAATMLMDVKTVFPGSGGQPDYVPNNYDGKFRGPVQMRYALGSSLNVPAVKMVALVGVEPMLAVADKLGLKTLAPTTKNLRRFGLAVTLGGGEVRLLDLTSAYSAFANGGKKVAPRVILKITDQDGKVLEENRSPSLPQVINEEEAFLISHILADNQARLLTFGENSLLNISSRQVAVKTGTTNDKRDNWTIGWTPQSVVGVWVGNNDNSPMTKVASGVSGSSPIWRRIILEILDDLPRKDFLIPEGIVSAEVDLVSGFRVHDGYPARLEYFIKGTEPQGEDPIHSKLKLCNGQEKLATLVDINRGHFEEKEYFVFREDDPVSVDGQNRWQQGIDAWTQGQEDSRFKPPTEYCQGNSDMEINLIKPADRVNFETREVSISAKAISLKEVRQIKVFVDGSLLESFSGKAFDKIYSLEEGSHIIKVEAEDESGFIGSKDVRIGVLVPWDWEPSPTQSPTKVPTITPTPVPLPTETSTPTPSLVPVVSPT
ncbi:transglycosylase domain-containing protein [Patescibacteria group bacterium]